MEIPLISDDTSAANLHGLGLAIRPNFMTSNHQISISAAIFSVNALARSTVKTNPHRITNASRTLIRKKRRTKRRSLSGGDDGDGDYGSVGDWFFGGECPIFGGGEGGGGFGGDGGGGGGGKGWNFGGFGGENWDSSSSSSSPADPAFDFVYEVVSWIVLSNCVHFAFKKVLRAVAGDAEREKVVPIRLTSVC